MSFWKQNQIIYQTVKAKCLIFVIMLRAIFTHLVVIVNVKKLKIKSALTSDSLFNQSYLTEDSIFRVSTLWHFKNTKKIY